MKQNWIRDTVIFFVSQTLSLLGSSLVQYALMWYVTLETKSGVMMPTFLLSPFAGVWADRHNRKHLIMLSDAMIALVTLVLALVFSAGGSALWLFFLAAAVRAVGSAIQGPAVGAILPQIVPAEQLTRVNGINGTIQSVIMLGSPALSGLLLGVSSIQAIFYIDVVTAILAIVVLQFFLKIAPHAKAGENQTVSYFADMKLGLDYIRGHRYLVSFFTYLGILMFLITPAAFLTPLQTVRTYGGEVWRLTAIELFFSGGMMAGGALISVMGGFRNRMRTMMLATVVMAVCTVALGMAPVFFLYLALFGVFGLAIPFYNTPAAVMLQEYVEEAYLGRVFSVMTMLSTSLMPLGMLVFGPLAEVVKIEWLLLGSGLCLLLLACTVPFNRRLLEAGNARG